MSQKNNVRRGQRHPQSFPPVYYMPRPPTTADQVDRWTNKRYELSSFWIIGKNPVNGIPVASGTEGDLYYLCKYESNGDATWCKFDIVPGGSGLDAIRDQVNAVVDVDASGYSDVDGAIVATAANPSSLPFETVKSASTLLLQMQIAGLVAPTPGDNTNVGVGCFNNNQFQKDATSGMFSLKGSTTNPPIMSFTLDDTNATTADANGDIDVNGSVVNNATNAKAVFTARNPSTDDIDIQVQVAKVDSSDPGKAGAGLASFDTVYHNITTNGYVSLEERLLQAPIGTTYNLGISYSSPTFTIHGSDGTALSATNPAWVVMPDNSTKGYKKLFQITSNYSFDDDSGTSNITGNTFGTTATVAWSQNMPFWIYFVINDANTAITPMISRNHAAFISTTAANIGKPSSAVADIEASFWALDDSITVGDYDTNPCVRVGTFTMQKNDVANDDWTVQPLTDKDGIGRTNFGVAFTMAILQNGATSRYLSSSNGGDTLPTFANDGYIYTMLDSGWVNINYSTTNIDNTPAGTGDIRLHLPYVCRESSWKRNNGGFSFDDSSLANVPVVGTIYATNSTNQYVTVRDYNPFGTATAALTPGVVANGDGNFNWQFTYRAFYE